MTKNGLDIQTISTKRTDFQTDRVLLFGQVTVKKEKANPSHFLKFLLANRTNGTFGFAPKHKADPSAKPKEPLFYQRFLQRKVKLLLTFTARNN
jgi:hypothetical protein